MQIKLPSLSAIIAGLKETFRMYPFALAAAYAGTFVSILMIEGDTEKYFKELMALALALPVFVSIAVFAERAAWDRIKILAANFAAGIFLFVYYLFLPRDIFEAPDVFTVRFLMWMAGFFLVATFIPFLKRWDEGLMDSFWKYNDHLARSFFITAVWGATLFIGLSAAMASVDFLFEVDIEPQRYAELFAVLAGVFGATFFLSRFTRPFAYERENSAYPKELKLFSQYVLVGLAAIYFVILYAYDIKILATNEWPKGTLAEMIIGFSFFGVIAYVALYPLMRTTAWIRRFGLFLFAAILPQTGMLFWALSFRLRQYGFTENRYFVFVFGLWLIGLSLYYLLSKKKDLRVIPITAFLIAFFTSFGPWGAFSVSERSQIARLDKILVANGMLKDGKIKPPEGEVDDKDRTQIGAIIQYLNNAHGFKKVENRFDRPLPVAEKPDYATEKIEITRWDIPRIIMEDYMGLEYSGHYGGWTGEHAGDFYVYADLNEQLQDPLDISGYDYMAAFDGKDKEAVSGPDKYKFLFQDNNTNFVVFKNDVEIARQDMTGFLKDLAAQNSGEPRNRDEMKFSLENDNGIFTIYFGSISGTGGAENPKITQTSGRIFWKIK